MEAATLNRPNGSQPPHRGTVKRRFTWEQLIPFPGNPIYEGRLRQMEASWGGYDHSGVGSPAIFDNADGAFPQYPDDALFIGDGCHRYELAKRSGNLGKEILADVHRGLSKADMFRKRRQLNDRRTVKPAEQFLARAEETNGIERAIRNHVEGLGWEITYERAVHGLSCTNELQWIWDKNKGALTRTIQTYEEAFGVKPHSNQARVLKGIGGFWIRYPDADPERLVKALKKLSVKEIHDSGKTIADQLTFIRTVWDGIRYSLAMSYNREGRKGQLKP